MREVEQSLASVKEQKDVFSFSIAVDQMAKKLKLMSILLLLVLKVKSSDCEMIDRLRGTEWRRKEGKARYTLLKMPGGNLKAGLAPGSNAFSGTEKVPKRDHSSLIS